VAYDLEEQEKIASLKAWWDRYGNALTSIVLGVAVAVAGYNVWQWYQRDRTAKAAGAYDDLQRAVVAKDLGRMREVTGVLLDKFGSTAYAEMGAMLAAKINLDNGDAKTAKAQLQWTIDKAVDPEYRALGRLRLAGVLLDEGSFDDALKQTATTSAAELSVPFQASFADRRGDIYLAQNKLDDAKREYSASLALLASRSESRGYANVVQLKLDGLMGGVVPVAAPTTPPAAPAATSSTEPPKATGAKQ
jgi:predicted negative regulator of RcsB-dependent stress response